MADIYADDIYSELEGFGIDSSVVTEEWIENQIEYFILPDLKKRIGFTPQTEETITEYVSGNGTATIMLRHKNATEIVSLEYVVPDDDTADVLSYTLIPDVGLIQRASIGGGSSKFMKGNNNIKVVYKIGSTTLDPAIKKAIILLTCEVVLGNIANRTGGGNLSTEGWSRDFGDRGKYTHHRNDLKRQAFSILSKYMSGVV